MSRTLNLVDRLLAQGRKYQQVGRPHEALHYLQRLAGLPELPPAVAEEAQVRLAELQLGRSRYRRARRHLKIALLYQPDSARYHYLMGTALSADEKADPRRAAEHYRKALELEPDQPACLRAYGLVALQVGQTEAGVQALYRAVELQPDDPAALGDLVEGLMQLGRNDEARGVLLAAQFRHARDRRFQQLWHDFQFRLLHDQQRAQRHAQAEHAAADEGSMLLPFVRPECATLGRRIRRDAASSPKPPHSRRAVRRSEQKHAQ